MNFSKANNIDFSKLYVTTEFPEATTSNLPQNIINKLISGYIGKKSEFTSLNQYRYQYFILFSNYKLNNIGNNMIEISLTETKHFEILAKKLVLSNVDPKLCRYIDNNPDICDYWIGSNISYVRQIQDIMEENIKLESDAIEKYNEILQETTDDNLRKLVTRILQDENSHLKYFKMVLEALYE